MTDLNPYNSVFRILSLRLSNSNSTFCALIKSLSFIFSASNLTIDPVNARENGLGFKHAMELELDLVGLNASPIGGELITPEHGDVFVGLDFQVMNVLRNQKYFDDLYSQGMKVLFVLYDLLPIDFPHFFEEQVTPAHENWLRTISRYSGVLCISQSVKERFRSWQLSKNMEVNDDFLLSHFPLGHDFLDVPASIGLPDIFKETISALSLNTSAIMVGTLELERI